MFEIQMSDNVKARILDNELEQQICEPQSQRRIRRR